MNELDVTEEIMRMSEENVALKTLRPLEVCAINGYLCEVVRQARRTTYVRALDCRLPGRVIVQLERTMIVRKVDVH